MTTTTKLTDTRIAAFAEIPIDLETALDLCALQAAYSAAEGFRFIEPQEPPYYERFREYPGGQLFPFLKIGNSMYCVYCTGPLKGMVCADTGLGDMSPLFLNMTDFALYIELNKADAITALSPETLNVCSIVGKFTSTQNAALLGISRQLYSFYKNNVAASCARHTLYEEQLLLHAIQLCPDDNIGEYSFLLNEHIPLEVQGKLRLKSRHAPEQEPPVPGSRAAHALFRFNPADQAIAIEIDQPLDLTLVDCYWVTDLTITGKGVSTPLFSYEQLAKFQSLKRLNLVNVGLTDLSFARNLQSLVHLNVNHNPVEDLSPLAGLEGLILLRVAGCKVKNFTPCLTLPRLENITVLEEDVNEAELRETIDRGLVFLVLDSNTESFVRWIRPASFFDLEPPIRLEEPFQFPSQAEFARYPDKLVITRYGVRTTHLLTDNTINTALINTCFEGLFDDSSSRLEITYINRVLVHKKRQVYQDYENSLAILSENGNHGFAFFQDDECCYRPFWDNHYPIGVYVPFAGTSLERDGITNKLELVNIALSYFLQHQEPVPREGYGVRWSNQKINKRDEYLKLKKQYGYELQTKEGATS